MNISFTLLKNCPVFNFRPTTLENYGAAVSCCTCPELVEGPTAPGSDNLINKNDAMPRAASFLFHNPELDEGSNNFRRISNFTRFMKNFQSKLLATAFAVGALFFVNAVLGQATVVSDHPDYAPRSTATFTGSGFAPNEVVVLKVKNLSYPCNTVFADSSYLPWTATADADGNFVTTWTVCNCPGDSLRLKATGQTSGLIAYAYFTDAANDPFYTATIDPVVGTIGVSGTYSITISNLTSNPGNPSFIGVIGSLRIAIPVGAGTPTGISITANDPGPIDRSANWALTLQTSTLLEFENAAAGSGAAANDIDPGGTIVITFTTTATTVGSKEWTTTTYRGNNFNNIGAISGSQPTVTICNPPTIGGQGVNATINCPATPTFTTPTASSTCGGTTINIVSDITTAGTCTGTYSETRSWDATDVNGAHSSTVSQTITVIDNTPPTIGSPGAGTTIDCPATPTFTPPTASDACNSASVVQVSDVTTAGTCTGTYSETRTWKAVDNCGNQSGTR